MTDTTVGLPHRVTTGSTKLDTLTDPAFLPHLKCFNISEDCSVFEGLFSFCQASA
jgi:hypothetical protein